MSKNAWLCALILLCLTPVGARWADPAADQLELLDPPAPDLTGVELITDGQMVTVKLTLDPASAGYLDMLEGTVDFDVDSNPATGGASMIEAYGSEPFPLMGVDYTLNFAPGWATLSLMTWQGPMPVDYGVPVVLEGKLVLTFPATSFCASGAPCLQDTCTVAVLLGVNGTPSDRAPNNEIPLTVGDLDGNGLVNDADVQWMRDCRTGPAVPLQSGCEAADLDSDQDVDQDDFGILQRARTP